MPKFSFIVPVYNTEKYLNKCIDSLINQTYFDYEIVLINDGSPDNSQLIIDSYTKTNTKIISYTKDNGGLSDARNYGVSKAMGDYLIFVDSDDYVDSRMLENINFILKRDGDLDLVRFDFAYVDYMAINDEISTLTFHKEKGELAFIALVNEKKMLEMACLYAYKRTFWLKNQFSFAKGKYHEDFGLIPLIIIKANLISNINKPLYYYVQTENSITRNQDEKKKIKKIYDNLSHYDYLKVEFDKIKSNNPYLKSIFYSYLSNALICQIKALNEPELTKYLKELRIRKVYDNLLSDTLLRKVKKTLLKIYPKLFIKVIK